MEEEVIKLLALIFLPVVVPVGVVLLFGNLKFLKLNADKGLFHQPFLWLSILVPVFYFLSFGGVIWIEYNLDVSGAGINTFFNISKIPLGLLSLALPLTVLVSRLHATEQTAKQISITQHKNNLDAFYSHRNELFSYFHQIKQVNYLESFMWGFRIHPRVHKSFFLGSPDTGIPELNITQFNYVNRLLNGLTLGIDSLLKCSENKKDKKYTVDLYFHVCSNIHKLISSLGTDEIYTDIHPNMIRFEDNPKGGEYKAITTIGKTTDELIAAYRYSSAYFRNLCDFSGYQVKDIAREHMYLLNGMGLDELKSHGVIECLHRSFDKVIKEKSEITK